MYNMSNISNISPIYQSILYIQHIQYTVSLDHIFWIYVCHISRAEFLPPAVGTSISWTHTKKLLIVCEPQTWALNTNLDGKLHHIWWGKKHIHKWLRVRKITNPYMNSDGGKQLKKSPPASGLIGETNLRQQNHYLSERCFVLLLPFPLNYVVHG